MIQVGPRLYPSHILTIGDENRTAFRISMGRLSRRGRWHGWQPCVFLIVGGKRR